MNVFLSLRYGVVACFLSYASTAPMHAQSVEVEVQKHFTAARQAQEAGLLDIAVREYKATLKVDPGVAEIYANLGLVYYAQAKFQESAIALAQAAKLKPGMTGVNLWLGVDYIKLGEPDKAVPLLREAVRRVPTDLQAERWLGTALWNSGQRFVAIDQLVKTSEMFPSDIDSFFVLGEAYRKAADEETERVLASAPDTALAHQVYGDIYSDQHAWVRAAAHYREASRLNPNWKGAHLGRGEVDLAQDQREEAKAEFQRELETDPSSAQASAHLAEIDLGAGELQGALSMLQEAIRASPSGAFAAFHFLPLSTAPASFPPPEEVSSRLRQERSRLQALPQSAQSSLALAIIDQSLGLPSLVTDVNGYRATFTDRATPQSLYARAVEDADLGNFDQAETALRSWLTGNPGDLKARYLSARILKSLSLETLDRMVALDPESPRVHQLLGQLYADRQEDDKALAEYRIVEQAQPTLPGIHYEIGHLLWQFGDRANALPELNRELTLNPGHAEANGEIGSILVVENQPERAIPYLQAALRSDPSLMLAHQQLGKAYSMQRDYKRAEEELQRAAVSDVDGSAHYQLWVVYRAEGRSEEASKALAECRTIRAGRLEENQNAARGTTTP